MDDIKEVEGRMKGLVVESPPFLDPTANFFDQDPFERVIEKVSSVTKSPARALRLVLFEIGDRLEEYSKKGEVTQEKIEHAATISVMNSATTSRATLGGDQEQKEKTALAMASVLRKYPYWYSYVATQIRGKYLVSGEVHPTEKSDTQVESYGYWVTKKLVREGRLKMKGMEEIFGENGEGKAASEFMSGSRASRRWEILSAAEITRKK